GGGPRGARRPSPARRARGRVRGPAPGGRRGAGVPGGRRRRFPPRGWSRPGVLPLHGGRGAAGPCPRGPLRGRAARGGRPGRGPRTGRGGRGGPAGRGDRGFASPRGVAVPAGRPGRYRRGSRRPGRARPRSRKRLIRGGPEPESGGEKSEGERPTLV